MIERKNLDPPFKNLCENYPLASVNELKVHVVEIFQQDKSFEVVTRQASIEEAEEQIIEECPGCSMPKILSNSTVKVFSCENEGCRRDFCRYCRMNVHMPYLCNASLFQNGLSALMGFKYCELSQQDSMTKMMHTKGNLGLPKASF